MKYFCQGCTIPLDKPFHPLSIDQEREEQIYCEKCEAVVESATIEGYEKPIRFADPEIMRQKLVAEATEKIEQAQTKKDYARERRITAVMCTKCHVTTEEKWPGSRIPTFLCRKCNLVWEYSNLQGFWTSTKIGAAEIVHMDITQKALKGESTMVCDAIEMMKNARA